VPCHSGKWVRFATSHHRASIYVEHRSVGAAEGGGPPVLTPKTHWPARGRGSERQTVPVFRQNRKKPEITGIATNALPSKPTRDAIRSPALAIFGFQSAHHFTARRAKVGGNPLNT
jgi:hypothetical protein